MTASAARPRVARRVLEVLWVFEAADGDRGRRRRRLDGGSSSVALDGMLHALDLHDGKRGWTTRRRAEISSSPAVRDGVVYFGDADGYLARRRRASGKAPLDLRHRARRSSRSANHSKRRSSSARTTSSSTRLSAGRRHVDLEGPDRRLRLRHAGARRTDDEARVLGGLRRFPARAVDADGRHGAAPRSSSAATSVPARRSTGGRPTSATYENQVVAVDLATARSSWTLRAPTSGSSRTSPRPPPTASGHRRRPGQDVHALDAKSGEQLWSRSFPTRGKVDSSPVIVGERVYFGLASGEVVALDLLTGEAVWSFDTARRIVGSPSVADGGW